VPGHWERSTGSEATSVAAIHRGFTMVSPASGSSRIINLVTVSTEASASRTRHGWVTASAAEEPRCPKCTVNVPLAPSTAGTVNPATNPIPPSTTSRRREVAPATTAIPTRTHASSARQQSTSVPATVARNAASRRASSTVHATNGTASVAGWNSNTAAAMSGVPMATATVAAHAGAPS
jgi:hypothetical protein